MTLPPFDVLEKVSRLKVSRNIEKLCLTSQLKILLLYPIQSNYTFIALNLHCLMGSKVLDPCHIQSYNALSINLPDSCGRKHTLKSQSGNIPHIPAMVYWWNPHTYIAMIYWWNSSAHGRQWELSLLPKDTKWQ